MRHWDLLGEARIAGTAQSLFLYQGKDDFFIRMTGGHELMSTRKHGSEDALGTLACQALPQRAAARVLVGGLGMGFTLAAVLRVVGPQAEVTVAELLPQVVDWNRGPLGERSGLPLNDPRTRIHIGDVAELLRQSREAFDVIALDVDNGPQGLTHSSNEWLYSAAGIAATRRALRPGGVLAWWSSTPHRGFVGRLQHAGLAVEEQRVHAHGNKGARHTIWLARAGALKPPIA